MDAASHPEKEAQPYFEKCSKQPLPNNLLDFCKAQAARKVQPVKKPIPKPKQEKPITITKDEVSPFEYLKSGENKSGFE